MAKFVVVYIGGAMSETPEAVDASMRAWMAWFGSMGSAVKDMGNPFSKSIVVHSDGSTGETSRELTGYTVLEADGIEHAATLVAQCPVLTDGGSVEIYEALSM